MLFSLCYVHRKEGNMRLYLSNAELIEFYPSKYLDEFCKQTKVKLIDVYNDYLDSYKAIRYDKLKIGTKYFPNHFIPIMKNISISKRLRVYTIVAFSFIRTFAP